MPPAVIYKHPETDEIYHARFTAELGHDSLERFHGERYLLDEVEDNLHFAYPNESLTRPIVMVHDELTEQQLAELNAQSTLKDINTWTADIPKELALVRNAVARGSMARQRSSLYGR